MASITSNYGLSKPLGSEAPDISVINDNMDTLDSELVVKTSNDIADATATKSTGWTTVLPVAVGEKVASVFEKFSTMAKNIRWIYKFLGTADISSIGDGTVTNALTTLNTAVGKKVNTTDIVNNLTSTSTNQPLSANMGKTLNDALSSKVGNNQGGANPVTFIQQANNGDLRVYGALNTWKTFQSDDHVLRCALYSFGSQTVAANTHTNLQLAKSIGGNIVAAFVTGTSNAAYVFANVNTISNSGVNIGVYNTASSAVTGTFTIAVLYTNT